MTGFSLGPRQFNFMAERLTYSHATTSEINMNGWTIVTSTGGGAGANKIAVFENKLDLRAFNADPGTALAMVNVAVQESGAVTGGTTNTARQAYTTIVDLISAVKIPLERFERMWVDTDAVDCELPGFLTGGVTGSNDLPENRQYNTSQIIYGKWRFFATNESMAAMSNTKMLQLLQAGEFGSGEVITAPHAYYYRVAVLANAAHTLHIPAANCSIHATTVDLPEFVELAQMARLGQR